IFVHYVAYICEITHYKNARIYLLLANVLFAAVLLADIITTAQGPTFTLSKRGSALYGAASSSMPISVFSFCAFSFWQG
ncbi:MAG: hypothetical protein IKF99_18060, partial [Oscillospiraceae bacterium]|nr:hypothetical protein [Oscillospiraceae bacterium]